MPFLIENGVLKKYEREEDEKEVIVPEGVKVIGENALSPSSYYYNGKIYDYDEDDEEETDCIESIILPDTVEGIESEAFCNCNNLKRIKLSEKLKYVENFAFTNCFLLAEMTIPDNIEYFDSLFFEETEADLDGIRVSENNRLFCLQNGVLYSKDMKTLIRCSKEEKEVIIPDSVEEIENYAFYNCVNLQKITFSANLRKIGDRCFTYCESLEKVLLPDSVKTVGGESFIGCSNLKTFKFSDNITEIEERMFCYCDNLTTVKLPKNLYFIGKEVFLECFKLKDLKLPKSVKEIEANAFLRCGKLY